MINKIKAEFACNLGVEYQVVDGAVYSEEFGETLDSMRITIDNVPDGDGLSGIAPYQMVKVTNEGDVAFDSEGRKSRFFLVDSFQDSLVSVSARTHRYQISLMSETKMLEKAQCPNLTITHSLADGQKTIAHYIRAYMGLYCPKAKVDQGDGTWAYEPIISVGDSIDGKFGVPCADLSLNSPTLRSALSALMMQIGCIPTVQAGVLGYIDLRAERTPVALDGTITAYDRSMSSDSYVNTLVSMPTQALDEGNEVISETVGFRDRDTAILRKSDSLKLNVSLPIYSVESLRIRVRSNVSVVRIKAKNITITDSDVWISAYGNADGTTSVLWHNSTNDTHRVENAVATLCSRHSISGFVATGTADFGSFDVPPYGYVAKTIPQTAFFWLSDTLDGNIRQIAPITAPANASGQYDSGLFTYQNQFIEYASYDITPLCAEASKRSLKSTDFASMASATTIEQISEYYYGCVQYSIGGKEITGFSQKWERAVAWWQQGEIWWDAVPSRFVGETGRLSDFPDFKNNNLAGMPMAELELQSIFGRIIEGAFDDFTEAIFDIEYHPLNSMALTYQKAEAPIAIEQYDSGDSGVVDFDRFCLAEGDKIARLGNVITSVGQTLGSGVIWPVNADLDGSTIFKREVAFRNGFAQASYTASENYAMQNYFTALTTKYRAYENVGYYASTVRKERDLANVRIGHEAIDGSDRISGLDLSLIACGCLGGRDSSIRYAYEAVGDWRVKLDVSVATSRDLLAISFQQEDNAFAGLRLRDGQVDTSVGGTIQSWVGYPDGFAEAHEVGFLAGIPFYADKTESGIRRVIQEPYIGAYAISPVFTLGDERVYHKDNAEIINETVQFAYYADCDDFLFSEGFIRASALVADPEWEAVALISITGAPFSFDSVRPDAIALATDPKDAISVEGGKITVEWPNGVTAMAVCARIDGVWRPICAFKGPRTEWHVSLNDTRTKRVYTRRADGMLALTGECGNGRDVI